MGMTVRPQAGFSSNACMQVQPAVTAAPSHCTDAVQIVAAGSFLACNEIFLATLPLDRDGNSSGCPSCCDRLSRQLFSPAAMMYRPSLQEVSNFYRMRSCWLRFRSTEMVMVATPCHALWVTKAHPCKAKA